MKNSGTRGNSWLNKQYGRVLRKVRLIDHLKKLGIDPRVLKKSYAEKHRKSPRKWWKSPLGPVPVDRECSNPSASTS